MKKILFISILMAASFLFTFSNADAAVCSACHTMHNSQDGTANSFDGSTHAKLLKGSCMGCHEDTTSANTTKNIASGVKVPVISNPNNAPNDPGRATSVSGSTMALAGGNFYFLTGGSQVDARGHNVNLVTNNHSDNTLTAPPGGVSGDIGGATRITCAGNAGCHGDRTYNTASDPSEGNNMSALAGAHHEGGAIDGLTVGKSFRFLKGVLGTEDSDWQQSASASDHNEYKGVNDTNGAVGSMSSFCAQCHGAFHGTTDVQSGSEWIRHPTDLSVIAQGGAYAGIGTTGYRIETPVARTTIGAAASTVTATQDIVMCLSCHRAHASPNDDILRWNYATMLAGAGGGASGTGCFYCHSDKD